ncbi:hypothetical protein LshimejAT787_2400570 [Lyophyllum shimeji]|uniref:Uncharacterized protein n=1 Tax=Lyophyllum shimeji TaxID=47721 RepID=A0A9P3Q1Z7_LYOSH|nr:hypothetical protein LshimejAT787_2400570 [Lyophyllum shimeji]
MLAYSQPLTHPASVSVLFSPLRSVVTIYPSSALGLLDASSCPRYSILQERCLAIKNNNVRGSSFAR